MRTRIIKLLEDVGPASGAKLARILGVSRQSVNYHLKKLVQSGRVRKSGRTRGTLYSISRSDERHPERTCRMRFLTDTHDEDEVFLYVCSCLSLESGVNKNVLDIFRYALTEMVNNAMEHSLADEGKVTASLTPYNCTFSVRDRGIGAFESIRKNMGLPDMQSAALEILKGKKTTAPSNHSGEGIFFTRQCADSFSLSANGILLAFDQKDSRIESIRKMKGTLVEFSISRASSRTLSAVFAEYAPESLDYSFSRTVIHLSMYSESLQSRSLARRIIAGIGDFREVILDFSGVRSLGQGFADEIFRVHSNAHPEIKLLIKELNPSLRPMIEHVKKGKNSIQFV